jgi:hypothetical protein
MHRAIRIAALLVFAGALGLAYQRLHRTPEQEDLTHYVERVVPSLLNGEAPIQERLARLGQAPGPSAAEARALLVDDVIPRLLKLRKQAVEVPTPTEETRALNDEYLAITDRLIEACRASVRVIDDPQRSTASGVAEVRGRFAEVATGYRAWDDHVRGACERHRLARPAGH